MDGTPFEIVLQQAAKLKTDQLSIYRRKYDSFPLWYQHSLFSIDFIINARKTMEFEELYQLSQTLKDSGNSYFEEGDVHAAINEYEKGLSLFKYLQPTREDWKKRVSTN